MPRVTYSPERKAEAVALAAVVGAEVAGQQLGIDHRTIRRWAEAAGSSVADTIDAPSWERLGALALARAEAMVATGKLTAIQLATMAGIAKRNAERPPSAGEPSAKDAQEALFDWLYDLMEAEPLPADVVDEGTLHAYLDEVEAALGEIPRHLLRCANAEATNSQKANGPHRRAILAWHSGRDEVPAGDVLEWAKAQVQDLIAEYGDLVTWHASVLAAQYREDVIRQRARVLADSGMRPHEALAMAAEISTDLAA